MSSATAISVSESPRRCLPMALSWLDLCFTRGWAVPFATQNPYMFWSVSRMTNNHTGHTTYHAVNSCSCHSVHESSVLYLG